VSRALEILEQLPDAHGEVPLPVREAQTLAMELVLQRALRDGLEASVLASPVYRRYTEQRRKEGQGA
jgi:hypothetical protein